MLIFERALKRIDEDMVPLMINIYLQRYAPRIFQRVSHESSATENFGVTRTRQIFEKAIEVLPPKDVKAYSLRYAALERKLGTRGAPIIVPRLMFSGEIDRARAILTHCAQFCPPNKEPDFWCVALFPGVQCIFLTWAGRSGASLKCVTAQWTRCARCSG